MTRPQQVRIQTRMKHKTRMQVIKRVQRNKTVEN